MHFGKFLEDELGNRKKSVAWLAKQMGYNVKTLHTKLHRGSITAQDIFEAMIILNIEYSEIQKIIKEERIFLLNGFTPGSGDSLSLMLYYKTVSGRDLELFFEFNDQAVKKIKAGFIKNIRLMVNPQDKLLYYEINCLDNSKQNIWPTEDISIEDILKDNSYTGRIISDDYFRGLNWGISILKSNDAILTQFILS